MNPPTQVNTHDVLYALIMRSDGAQSRGDDGLIQGHEEHTHAQRRNDEEKLDTLGIYNVTLLMIVRFVGCRCLCTCCLALLVGDAVGARRVDLGLVS